MFLSNFSFCYKYVHLELIAKEVIEVFFVSAYLQLYEDDSSKVFIYSSEQVERFGSPHIRAMGWYFDCRVEYTSLGKEALFFPFTTFAPIEAVVYKEEALQSAQVVTEKKI